MLSKEAAKESLEGFKGLIRNGFSVILLITIPASVGMMVLAQPIVRLAFERGSFDPLATKMTSVALIFYSVGLVGTALRLLMNKVFYSLQDTKTPMYNGFLSLGLNIVFNLILIKHLAHGGLALATSIATSVTTGALIYRLRQKIGSLRMSKMALSGFKSLFSSLIMGIIVYLTYYPLESRVLGNTILELAILLGVASLGAAVYFLIIYLLKVEEISWFVKLFKNKLRNMRFNNL